ncbi:thioredoxin domain-containing protein [Botrimarina sp.]|uniref:thioredoxin domain-containing protein n=1 Tax=Botrimarina sp. TaxID=2795802 RepID=UPI0032EC138D
MPNALANETSPYLLQHKDNPVDWRPWGEEALALARDEDKPIFLSIGYAACHWCHVMEHESFEDPGIAAALNDAFVCIKVDREERPDLDQIYMNAVQAMTGRGGWPMSVFCTPEGKPFYGGTYWPPTAQRGMPGFDQVIEAVTDAWRNRREQAIEMGEGLAEKLAELTAVEGADAELAPDLITGAGRQLERSFDPNHGGFGQAPKFPHTMDLGVLLRLWKSSGRSAWLDIVSATLRHMATGGIYDHLGGGFARYSVDERWLVPHFEKMLYDNALLAGAYADAYAATGQAQFKRIACETLDYLLRDMTSPEGGFYSTEDADSPPPDDPGGRSEEGLYYTWKPEEIRKVLGEDEADIFCRVYDVTPIGNFEGRNVLSLPKPIAAQAKHFGLGEQELARQLAEHRQKLLAAREKRPRPGLDDKVLSGWNGLAIEAMARAGAAFGENKYVQAAGRAADFVLGSMRDADGRLLHTYRSGQAKLAGYLDDYAAMAGGLITLYEATFDERRLGQAAELLDAVLERFADAESGGFYYTADDHEKLIVRNKDLTDGATPGGASLAATALVRLGKLTGRADYLRAAEHTLRAAAPLMERAPTATGQMLAALDLWLGPTDELVLLGVGPDAERVAAALRAQYAPRRVLAGRIGPCQPLELLSGLFQGKTSINGEATLYVCRDHACAEPLVGEAAIRSAVLS